MNEIQLDDPTDFNGWVAYINDLQALSKDEYKVVPQSFINDELHRAVKAMFVYVNQTSFHG